MPDTNQRLPYVKPGDAVKAAEWNDLTRLLNSLSGVGDDAHVISTAAGKFIGLHPKKFLEPDLILVRNDTGAEITAEHPVLGIGDVVILPADVPTIVHEFPVSVKGETPAAAHAGKFAILMGPVPKDGWQVGIVSGVAWVQVLVNSATDEFADVDVGEVDRLETGASGAQILFLQSDQGDTPDVRWALVRLGGGGDACLTVHEIRTDGTVSGGTFNLDVTINDPDGNVVTETLGTFAWNITAAALKTEYVTHTEIASTDIGVIGGPFPDAAIYVVFLSAGTLNRHHPVPVPDSTSVTGGGRIKTQQVTSVDWEHGL